MNFFEWIQYTSLELEHGHSVQLVKPLGLTHNLLWSQCWSPDFVVFLEEQVGGKRDPPANRTSKQIVDRPTGCLAYQIEAGGLDGGKYSRILQPNQCFKRLKVKRICADNMFCNCLKFLDEHSAAWALSETLEPIFSTKPHNGSQKG